MRGDDSLSSYGNLKLDDKENPTIKAIVSEVNKDNTGFIFMY